MNWITLIIVLMVLFFIVIILYYAFKYLRKSRKSVLISSFKCIDGHVVKSKGELIIDNFLHINGIKHIYEKTIKVNGHSIKYDWYLPDIRIYIEYWGYYGKEYEARKKEKIKLYKKGKMLLLSIENEMFDDIYSNLRKKLGNYINITESRNQIRHCPNCGVILDDRFTQKSKSINI